MNGTQSVERKPLYRIICEHITNGALPEDFSLPEAETDGVRFADGARDGILRFHAGPAKLTDEDHAALAKGITAAAADAGEADAILAPLFARVGALSLADATQEYLIGHQDRLQASALFQYGLRLMMESPDREMVKLGMTILELLGNPPDEIKKVIFALGLSDEFTLFSLFCMRCWEGGNDDIFRLAQKVRGWGRVHAVEHLEPETRAIRDWLLREGCHNDVMREYSAMTCWKKSDAAGRLADADLAQADFDSISEIVAAMVPGGPVPGVETLGRSGLSAMALYVSRAAGFAVTEPVRSALETLSDHAGEDPKWREVKAACERLLAAGA